MIAFGYGSTACSTHAEPRWTPTSRTNGSTTANSASRSSTLVHIAPAAFRSAIARQLGSTLGNLFIAASTLGVNRGRSSSRSFSWLDCEVASAVVATGISSGSKAVT